MVSKDTLKRVLVENAELAEDAVVVTRPLALEDHASYVFTGPRRAGKSYLMVQVIKGILAAGGSRKDYLYVRFEDERLYPMTAQDLDGVLDAHGELYGDVRPTVFLDEIQEVPGWERFVRRLVDAKYRVFVTGSNATMLSRDVAAALGGRFVDRRVLPYSFAEYLTACGVSVTPDDWYGRRRATLAHHFDTWFRWGGFPESLAFDNRRVWLDTLYQRIFYGDIVVRHGIRNGRALRLLVRKLAQSVTDPISLTRMKNTLSSTGTAISTSTVGDYLGYLEESYMTFSSENMLKTLSERSGAKKYYFVDNGLLTLFRPDNRAQLLENVVAVELLRRGHRLAFAQDGPEVDFYVEETDTLVQVCASLADPQTEHREMTSLAKIDNRVGATNLTIVTMDEKRSIDLGGKTVAVVPVMDWIATTL